MTQASILRQLTEKKALCLHHDHAHIKGSEKACKYDNKNSLFHGLPVFTHLATPYGDLQLYETPFPVMSMIRLGCCLQP